MFISNKLPSDALSCSSVSHTFNSIGLGDIDGHSQSIRSSKFSQSCFPVFPKYYLLIINSTSNHLQSFFFLVVPMACISSARYQTCGTQQWLERQWDKARSPTLLSHQRTPCLFFFKSWKIDWITADSIRETAIHLVKASNLKMSNFLTVLSLNKSHGFLRVSKSCLFSCS